MPLAPRCTRLLPLLVGVALLGPAATGAREKPLQVSIYSKVAKDYEREQDENGHPLPEYYGIGYGGTATGTSWAGSQNKDNFPRIASLIGQHLAEDGYHFAKTAEVADLMLVIHWGTTDPYNDINYNEGINLVGDAMNRLAGTTSLSQGAGSLDALVENDAANGELESALMLMAVEERERNRLLWDNAVILGYHRELRSRAAIPGSMGDGLRQDINFEIEDPRYYVVVSAFDFADLVNRQKKNLRWVTRFSIRARGNDFMANLDEMVARAGNYFGRDSGGLIRHFEGEVEIGEVEVIESNVAEPEDE